MVEPVWTYADTLVASRRQALSSPPRFAEIVASISRQPEILCGHRQLCDNRDGFERVVFCVSVPAELFDLYFNSVEGYRAHYFVSVDEGHRANRLLIESLVPTLVGSHLVDLPPAAIESSLGAASAKSWLAEVEKHLCERCLGEWTYPADESAEILNGRWELVPNPCGRKAPAGTKIRLFGGFVDKNGTECVPPGKAQRAQELRDTGWT